MSDPEEIMKNIPPEVLLETYKDVASKPLTEISKIGLDVVKTARLLLAPLQITSAFQDRFEKFVKNRISKIPKDKQISASPEIVGPAIEKMQYLNEDSPLWKMFEELLLKSVNKDELDKAHPSFVHIISQLSHDEAILLYELNKVEFEFVDVFDMDRINNRFINRRFEKKEAPLESLIFPDNLDLYYNHLDSLSLVNWPVYDEKPIRESNTQTGTRRRSRWVLTDFGKLFINACIPKEGF